MTFYIRELSTNRVWDPFPVRYLGRYLKSGLHHVPIDWDYIWIFFENNWKGTQCPFSWRIIDLLIESRGILLYTYPRDHMKSMCTAWDTK